MDIVSKVKKLLALASSPNENEARSALLKARALMAEYKLTDADIDEKSKALTHLKSRDVIWDPSSEHAWLPRLADLLAEQQCCVISWTPDEGGKYAAVISGFPDEAGITRAILEYTAGFVHNKLKENTVSYAFGFIAGLEIAFEIQNAENPEWALVLSTPKEVKDFADSLKTEERKSAAKRTNALSYLKGVNDGVRFQKTKAIDERKE